MPGPLARPKCFRIRCDFLRGHEYINVRVEPGGLISFREPRARTWKSYPMSKIYFMACLANAERRRA